jgi:2',3'-cyclic-nucleotide 2'-phosphodiesterase (5'-nucleotidase family)
LHGYILQDKETPGALKLASLIKREVAEAGGREKCLLVDSGDSFAGSFENAATRGAIMPPFYNALRYDAWIPGNHDLDFGPGRFVELVSLLKCRTLAANLYINGAAPLKPWALFKKSGLSIALIGMESPYLDNWLWGAQGRGVKAAPPGEALDALMPEILRAKPDIIVMAYHGGLYSPERLGGDESLFECVRRHPEIDLVLGGHSHIDEPGRRIGLNTWFVQAGAHGEALACVSIEFDAAARRISKLESRLLRPESLPPDPELSALLKPDLERVASFGSRVVGPLPDTSEPEAKTKSKGRKKKSDAPNGLLIHQAIAKAADCRIAFHTPLSVPPELFASPLTEYALHSLLPYENILGTIELTTSECRALIEEQLALKDKKKRLAVWGLDFKVDKGGHIEGPLRLADGSEWSDEGRRLAVAFSGYDLAGGGGRYPLLASLARKDGSSPRDFGISTRDAFRAFIEPAPACKGVRER